MAMRERLWLGKCGVEEGEKQVYQNLQKVKTDFLEPRERLMLELVKEGDIEQLSELLKEYTQAKLDINKRDQKGQFPLQVAVVNQSEEVIQFLLQIEDRPLQLGDALLHAVDLSNERITAMLLDWKERKEEEGVVEEFKGSPDYASHMTPLMLACINNDYNMIWLLLDRNHFLPPFGGAEGTEFPRMRSLKEAFRPRLMTQRSDEKNVPSHDTVSEKLEVGAARLDDFRAKSSTVYMCLTSEDPILTATYLIERAEKWAFHDSSFSKEYEEISATCRAFVVSLLNECRASSEVEMLLSQGLCCSHGINFPRLKLAIDKNIKEFVTHKNCQKVMKRMWTGDNPDILRFSVLSLFVNFVPQLLLLPFAYVAYFFFPRCRWLRFYRTPMIKFFGDCASFSIFLCLLAHDTTHGHRLLEHRGAGLLNWIDISIILYLVCFVIETGQTVNRDGFQKIFTDSWLMHMVLMSLCFIGCFGCRLVSFIIARARGDDYKHESRIFWHWSDPMLVAECFYCIGIFFAFTRILYPFQLTAFLGPIQLYINRMLTDVKQMFFMFMVTILAFSMSLTRLFAYYQGMTRIEDGELEEQPDQFAKYRSTLKTLFWDMFGYGDADAVNLVVRNTCPPPFETQRCFNTSRHVLSEATGYTLYAVYHIVTIIILVNALIALMSNTLSKVQENLDEEWKFNRAVIWMTYFERDRVLPSPLFLIPSPNDVFRLFKWMRKKCCKKSSDSDSPDAKCGLTKCCAPAEKDSVDTKDSHEDSFSVLMERLIARYLNQIHDDEEASGIRLEDLEKANQSLLQEIAALTLGGRKSFWKTSFINKVKKRATEAQEQ